MISFLLLAGIFVTIGSVYAQKNRDYTKHEKESYRSINVTVDEYNALHIKCKDNVHKSDFTIQFEKSYTGVIIVKFNVGNDTYYDEERVVCGDSYIDAMDRAKQEYPKSKPILMYYEINDPGAGVVFEPNFIGPYWIEVLICFLMGSVCLGLSLLSCWPTKNPDLIILHGSESWDSSYGSEPMTSEQKLLLGD